jgi:hypothetical protein
MTTAAAAVGPTTAATNAAAATAVSAARRPSTATANFPTAAPDFASVAASRGRRDAVALDVRPAIGLTLHRGTRSAWNSDRARADGGAGMGH